jgi:hypothetical protein
MDALQAGPGSLCRPARQKAYLKARNIKMADPFYSPVAQWIEHRFCHITSFRPDLDSVGLVLTSTQFRTGFELDALDG